MRSFLFVAAFLSCVCTGLTAQAACGHVPGETFYFQGTEAPDYFTFQHDFNVSADTTDTTDTVWSIEYCVSLDDGQGGYQEYAHSRYFYQDSGSHLVELTGKATDDFPTRVDDFDRFPLNYTDLNFYVTDTGTKHVRLTFGVNDDTILVTVSARLKAYAGTCQ